MAAPNKQPAGSRPGPGKVHEHKCHEGVGAEAFKPSPDAHVLGATNCQKPSTPKPVGANKKNPLR